MTEFSIFVLNNSLTIADEEQNEGLALKKVDDWSFVWIVFSWTSGENSLGFAGWEWRSILNDWENKWEWDTHEHVILIIGLLNMSWGINIQGFILILFKIWIIVAYNSLAHVYKTALFHILMTDDTSIYAKIICKLLQVN